MNDLIGNVTFNFLELLMIHKNRELAKPKNKYLRY